MQIYINTDHVIGTVCTNPNFDRLHIVALTIDTNTEIIKSDEI